MMMTNAPTRLIIAVTMHSVQILRAPSLVLARLGTVATEKHAMTLMSVLMTETIAMFKRLV